MDSTEPPTSRGAFLRSGIAPASCNICLEPFDSDNHKPIEIRGCGHIFARSCLVIWLQNSHTQGTCPNCRSVSFALRTPPTTSADLPDQVDPPVTLDDIQHDQDSEPESESEGYVDSEYEILWDRESHSEALVTAYLESWGEAYIRSKLDLNFGDNMFTRPSSSTETYICQSEKYDKLWNWIIGEMSDPEHEPRHWSPVYRARPEQELFDLTTQYRSCGVSGNTSELWKDSLSEAQGLVFEKAMKRWKGILGLTWTSAEGRVAFIYYVSQWADDFTPLPDYDTEPYYVY